MLKIDWLSFTFKPTDDDIATHNDILSAFLSYFPIFENVFSECVVFGSGRGRYFDNCVVWNDNILISWDNADTSRLDNLKSWDHGINVCIPSHGLCNIFYLLGISSPGDGFIFNEYREIYFQLKSRHCQISRLDIAYDDFSKTFYPIDFLKAWLNDEIQSPCKKFKWCEAGKGGGQTFYIGGRSNKLLRIYDKSKESHGEIDSIRYEIELHNKYANEVSELILNDNFDFISYFEKYFIILKKQKENCAHVEKRYNSRLDNSIDWENWKKSSFANNKNVVFPKRSRSVSMEQKEHWIKTTVLPSIVQYIKFVGIDVFINMLNDVVLNDYQVYVVNDALRVYKETYCLSDSDFNNKQKKKFTRLDILKDISSCIVSAFD